MLYGHSYHITVNIRDRKLIEKDYEYINLKINLPDEIASRDFSVKINGELYHDWILTDDP